MGSAGRRKTHASRTGNDFRHREFAQGHQGLQLRPARQAVHGQKGSSGKEDARQPSKPTPRRKPNSAIPGPSIAKAMKVQTADLPAADLSRAPRRLPRRSARHRPAFSCAPPQKDQSPMASACANIRDSALPSLEQASILRARRSTKISTTFCSPIHSPK